MSWEKILKESRLEELRTILRKYYDDEYVDWITENTTEDSVDEYIKWEIGELKANLGTVPKDGKFSDGRDATPYINSSNNLIRELERV